MAKYSKKLDENGKQKKLKVIDMLEALLKLPQAFSEIIKMMRGFLTLHITTAEDERYFAQMKRVKNYLRATTSEDRLEQLKLKK